MPLNHAPLCELPKWGHWIETPSLIVALVPPGNLEVRKTLQVTPKVYRQQVKK